MSAFVGASPTKISWPTWAVAHRRIIPLIGSTTTVITSLRIAGGRHGHNSSGTSGNLGPTFAHARPDVAVNSGGLFYALRPCVAVTPDQNTMGVMLRVVRLASCGLAIPLITNPRRGPDSNHTPPADVRHPHRFAVTFAEPIRLLLFPSHGQ